MRAVKSSWGMYKKVTMILGAALLGAAVVFLILWLALEDFVLGILAVVLGANGAVWFILGIIFLFCAKSEKDKLKRLKSKGLRYDGKVERVIRDHYWIRMGSMLSGHAECSYHNKEGKKCLVKSGSFILEEQNPDYKVSVYVSRDNPADYSVSVEVKTSGQIDYGQFDYDYR